jgi:four helix bundle protein
MANDIPLRLRQFSLRCYKLTEALPKTGGARYFQNQLLRSSMSAYANYKASQLAQSKASFVAKLSIALEETDESAIWLDMIITTELLPETRVFPLYKEAKELSNILASARKKTKQV